MKLMEKVKDLATFAWNDLRHAIAKADKSEDYSGFAAAMKLVHVTEAKLKAVRAHIRAQMRKTKAALQKTCPHVVKEDTRVREDHSVDPPLRVVEFQTCTACTKSFDLREKVS